MKFKVSKSSLSYARIIHVYVSMALLLLMLFFAITGITLNHPNWFSSADQEPLREQFDIPSYLIPTAPQEPEWRLAAGHWLKSQWDMDITTADIDEDEISLVSKGPGTYRTVTLDLLDGKAYIETLDYGVVAVLNDLHKGRNTGSVWAWVLDLCALLIILFSLTGAYLLLPQTKRLKKSLFYMVIVSSGCALVYVYFVP
ncbi:PepSY-associated TM helix domain-containing protein [Shewanella xiamenensis]|uniref:PepSY-associated TM helix domain-containing protein n=1 Tax=Shewanella TaxID=22 RepID=UPI000B51E50D|nr:MULTISPECIES: PepSY-associated TM helix domain-containing protein [Shewanella]ASF15387.1 peptidase [Shewanella sp. FDAARGOS_354]MBW0295064.1 peptidase [Shewanella xiamenensis]MCL1070128.1 PepSY-associated TM helix domain-containing protein [Shewanella xiamenensis]MDH1315130.1 PepSY-associated TM helix domain-containing protein [Shewanella xiamenensis]NMD50436.1 peptidase [Shewanella sp. DNRA4]